MRILALYPFLPYPAVSGATLRGRSILDILATQHEVTLASFVGRGDQPSELPSWTTYPAFAREPLLVSRQPEEHLTAAGKSLRALLPQSRVGLPDWLNYFDTAAMWNRIAELDLSQFDAVHVRYVSMTRYALALKAAAPHLRLVVDLDDIPSVFLYRKLRHPKEKVSLRASLWQAKELFRMYAFERSALRSFDSVWICSGVDFTRISKRIGAKRTLVVENVVDAKKLATIDRQQTEPALLLIGDFSYGPNREGADFFVNKVWPEVRLKNPEAQLWLVGSHPDAGMQEWNEQQGILVTGRVEDVWPYLARATASIAPLFGGSGTRLKILEALGAGLPVVTTTLGTEGI
jgi:polysaccharide biosynthesis protein PslH